MGIIVGYDLFTNKMLGMLWDMGVSWDVSITIKKWKLLLQWERLIMGVWLRSVWTCWTHTTTFTLWPFARHKEWGGFHDFHAESWTTGKKRSQWWHSHSNKLLALYPDMVLLASMDLNAGFLIENIQSKQTKHWFPMTIHYHTLKKPTKTTTFHILSLCSLASITTLPTGTGATGTGGAKTGPGLPLDGKHGFCRGVDESWKRLDLGSEALGCLGCLGCSVKA